MNRKSNYPEAGPHVKNVDLSTGADESI